MEYTVGELAKLSGLTVKTLHHFHRVGLFQPVRIDENGYRYYGEHQLEDLQQILFYRELDFPLARIRQLVGNEQSRLQQLREQKALLLARQEKTSLLLQTLDDAIAAAEQGKRLNRERLFHGFNCCKKSAYIAEKGKGDKSMKQPVLFAILPGFADWEYAFLATALQDRIQDKTSAYEVKTVAPTNGPIRSLGGFTLMPDLTIENIPADYAGLVLLGGTSLRTEAAKTFIPLIKQAYAEEKIVGAICDATVFLGMNGLLNERNHTSNTLEDLVAAAGEQYTGNAKYQNEQAVRDGNLITANGTGYLEFTKEMLLGLDAYPAEYIESNYQFFKIGFVELSKEQ